MRARFIPLALILILPGCGWITGTSVGLTGGSSDSGSTPSNAQPNFGDVALTGVRTSPATVRFTLVDNESDPVDVRLYYSVNGGAREAMTLANGEADLDELATSRTGVQHTRRWDFEDQIGAGYRDEVEIEVEIVSQTGRGELEVPLVQTRTVALGNDAPELLDVSVPPVEVTGIAALDMRVRDSSSDLVDIQLEYDLVGDEPDRGFQPATAAGNSTSRVLASPEGTPFTFFWDVVGDEGFTDSDVRLRITPTDGDLAGASQEATLLLDNNTAPSATINIANFLSNTDRRRGIPVPFEVFDGNPSSGEPADDVRLVFQWRRSGELFPELPGTVSEIEAILADPEQRKLFQIATERPIPITGRTTLEGIVNPNDRKVRLRELAASAFHVLRKDAATGELTLQGELELLRPAGKPVALQLPSGVLESPVGAFSTNRGLTALVLDQPASGGWRLQEIDLARKVALRTVAADPTAGAPTALAPDRAGALVASEVAGTWKVQRVQDGVVNDIYESDGSLELGAIRGICALRGSSCLLTVGSSLIQLIYPPAEPTRVIELYSPTAALGPMQMPWGVWWDSTRKRALVAENGADRILEIPLDALTVREVKARGLGFPAPEALTFDPIRSLLLVITDEGRNGERELRGLELDQAMDRDADGFADAEVFEILPGTAGQALTETVGGIEAGPDGLQILALTSADDLAVSGGLEQVRTIVAIDYARQTVTVDAAFDPPFDPAQPVKRWRIPRRLPARFPASPTGESGVFVWDCEADTGGGDYALRLIPMDQDLGSASSTVEARPFLKGPTSLPQAIDLGFSTLGDLDGDGDLDSVANGNGVGMELLLQTAPGEFTAGPVLGAATTRPIAVGDFDSDGDLDILANDSSGNSSSIFFQTDPGEFAEGPPLGGSMSSTRVIVGDFDSDGDDDVLVGPDLVIYFQTSPGVLQPGPTFGPQGFLELDLAVGDLDSDGDLDVALALYGSGNDPGLKVIFQTSPGEFTEVLALDDGLGDFWPTSVSIANLDGDGDLDIVTGQGSLTNPRDTFLTRFIQTAPGAFELGEPIDEALGSSGVLAAGDLDGDGDVDLATALRSAEEVVLYFQVAPGEFEPGSIIGLGGAIIQFSKALVTQDVDGDGLLDLIVQIEPLETRVIRQYSPGHVTSGLDLGSFGSPFSPVSLGVGDLDSDGDLDFASVNVLAHNMTLFFQTSPGTIIQGPTLGDETTTANPVEVRMADVDGDGDLDIVTANRGVPGGEIREGQSAGIFFQTSPGVFEPGLNVGDDETTPDVNDVALGDLDGDGDLDLVTANLGSGNLSIFFQTAPGTFVFSEHVAGSSSVTVLDLDNDGDLDIVSGRQDLIITLQTSPGTFEPGPVIERAGGRLADLDGDGWIDSLAVEGDVATASALVFAQTSPLSFTLHSTFDLGPKVGSIITADMDSDGDLEVIITGGDSGGDKRVAVFQQTAPLLFTRRQALTDFGGGSTVPFGGVAADLDSDGDPDIATANFFSGIPITVFWGSH